MLKKLFILSALVFSNFSYAENLGTCTFPKALKNGINYSDYQQCKTSLNTCPKHGAFIDDNCLKEKSQQAFCQQLVDVAKQLETSAEMLSFDKQENFTILHVTYPADGGNQYYLLSPKNCLINTLVDPRDLDASVKTKYAKKDFYLEVIDEPKFSTIANSNKQFTISVEARDQCRACKVIGTGNVAFTFTGNGEWVSTKLLSFTKKRI
jgi:hypothetical protein